MTTVAFYMLCIVVVGISVAAVLGWAVVSVCHEIIGRHDRDESCRDYCGYYGDEHSSVDQADRRQGLKRDANDGSVGIYEQDAATEGFLER